MRFPRRPAWAEIDLGAIVANYRALAAHTGVPVMGVVKADAYGHGAVPVCRALEALGPPLLAVATLGEAVELRDAGIERPVMIFSCLLSKEAQAVAEHGFIPQISDLAFAQSLSDASVRLGKRTSVHLKIDTGMGRCGVLPADAVPAGEKLASLPGLSLEGVMTHFPSSDEADGVEFTEGQVKQFKEICDALAKRGVRVKWRHAANSGGTLGHPGSWFDMVRPGMSLYGVYPSPAVPRDVPLRQAMTLKAQAALVKTIAKGETISYGRTYTAPRDMRVALVPIGYADGYDRRFSNQGAVLARGRRFPVVGRVCMDQFMVDVTDCPEIAVGDEVVLYGRQGAEEIAISEAAETIGTIPQVIVTSVSRRVPRVYRDA